MSFIKNQNGNIFFTLFGAVAIVGLLGTVIVSTMRGPLSTMVEVQARTQAESEMAIASRLALLEATELASDGDCDADGFVEPLEYTDAGASDAPAGGGFLPSAVASTHIDPWGTQYGYCAWDAGGTTGAIACDISGNSTNERLDGNGSLTDETYTIIALVSAGPDQVFGTTCTGGATPSISKTGDDIVVEYTYATATAATGGLWNIKSGDASTAEISKNLEITGGASFTAGIDLTSSSAALQLGAASMLFPSEVTLTTCNAANDGLVRINTAVDPDVLQLCDDPNGWVSGGGGVWSSGTGDAIYYDTGTFLVGIGTATPAQALDVVGSIAASANITAGGNISSVNLAASGDGTIGGTLGVTGATTLAILNATGAVDFDSSLNVDGNSTLAGTLGVTGATTLAILNATGAVDFDSSLNVDGTSTLIGAIDAQGNISDSLGDVTISDNLVVTGTSDLQGAISNSTGNIVIGDNVDVSGAITATGNIDGLDITASSDLIAGSAVMVNGDQLGPALGCTSAQKLLWTNGSGWSCIADLLGGSSGAGSDLEDVLTADNNAAGLDAVNLGSVGIGTATPTVALEVVGRAIIDDGATDNIFISGGVASTTGLRNIAIGRLALSSLDATCPTCDDNIAIGHQSLELNTLGRRNTAVGYMALQRNVDGGANVAVGYQSLRRNVDGVGNVAVGGGLQYNVSGSYNTAIGSNALFYNTANFNAAFGRSALYNNTTGGSNIAVGSLSMFSNVDGSQNTVLGNDALRNNVDGSYNAAFGNSAGRGVASASPDQNAFFGASAGSGIDTGSFNIFMGYQAGNSVTTGNTNIIIGYDADTPTPTTSNYLNIGDVITGDLSTGNIAIAGTAALTVPSGTEAQRPTVTNGMIRYKTNVGTSVIGFEVYEAGAWVPMGAAVSDERLKTDIKPLEGANILDRLGMVNTYSYKMKNAPEGKLRYGVIAQELVNIFPELVTVPIDSNEMMSVRYQEFIAPIIEATKELRSENLALRADIEEIKQQVALLNKVTGSDGGNKASMGMYFMLLFGLLAGILGTALIIKKRRLH